MGAPEPSALLVLDCVARSAMPEQAWNKQNELAVAFARFDAPSPTLDQLMAGVEPLASMDQLDISDLTDEEREAFARALDEE